MSVSRSWALFFALLASGGCSSSTAPSLPAPAGAPQTDPTPSSPSVDSTPEPNLPGVDPAPTPSTPESNPSPDPPQEPEPLGGQSGTDSGGAYNCDGEGAPPLESVPLDAVPKQWSCAPAEILASISGTRTFDQCTVERAIASDAGPYGYIYPVTPGPSVVLAIEPGTAAHLLDAVLKLEQGGTGSCTLLGVDVSADITIAGASSVLHADQVIVDRFCYAPSLRIKGRLDALGSEEDVNVLIYFEELTGRVRLFDIRAQTYTMDCIPSTPPAPVDAGVGNAPASPADAGPDGG